MRPTQFAATASYLTLLRLLKADSDWLWRSDDQHRIIEVEGNSLSHARAEPDQIGLTGWQIGARNMTAADWEAHRQVLENREPFRDLRLEVLRGQELRWISLSGVPGFSEEGRFEGYVGVGRDITVQVQAEKRLKQLADIDPLTGLANRRLMQDRIEKAAEAAARTGHPIALLFLDLNGFKLVNDHYGHAVGDDTLKQVAERLQAVTRESDSLSRIGGDEFLLLIPILPVDRDVAEEVVTDVADRMCSALHQPVLIDGQHVSLGVSIGALIIEHPATDTDALIRHADQLMYHAKALPGAGQCRHQLAWLSCA